MKKLKNLKKSFVVITGANNGIGLELTKLYSENNVSVLALDLKTDNLNLPHVEAMEFDVARDQNWEKLESHPLFQTESLKTRPLVHWYNNAGVSGLCEAKEQNLTTLRHIFEINFWAVVRGTQFAYEKMGRQDIAHPRSIINMSSMSAFIPAPMMSAYSSSKAALRNYSLSFQEEVQDVKIHVVTPGFVKTDILNSHATLRLPEWMLKRASDLAPTVNEIVQEVLAGNCEIIPDVNGKRLYKLWRVGPGLTRKLSHYLLK